MRTPRVLRRAIRLWQQGEVLPLDLYAELVELGMCVETLERKHSI